MIQNDGLSPENLQRLIDSCRDSLGEPDQWIRAGGYPESLALCVIDSIFSIGVRYGGVVKVVNRYRAFRKEQGASADTDGVDELLASFTALGDDWVNKIGTRQRTSTRNGILKSDAVERAASVLQQNDIRTTSDLQAAVLSGEFGDIKRAWLNIPGQRSGISWNYLLILARPAPSPDGPSQEDDRRRRYGEAVVGVKPDRMVIRFVSNSIDPGGTQLRPDYAAALVKEAARSMCCDVSDLDHAIWRYQSGRSHTRSE